MSKNDSIAHKRLLVSFIITSVSVFACSALSGFKFIYSTNDDYLISWLITQGEGKSYFINYFLQSFFVLIQKLLPFINCFCVFQSINCVLSLIVINYVIVNRFSLRAGIALSAAVSIIVSMTCIVMVQWTHTTTLMCTAGFLLLYYAWDREKSGSRRIILIVFSALFVVIGSLFRFVSFEICILFWGVFLLCKLIEDFVHTKASFIHRITGSIKGNAKIIISVILLVGISFSLNIASSAICNSDEVFRNNKEYNHARAMVNDYQVSKYEGNEAFYDSVGVKSQEDIDLLTRRHVDKDFYTSERMEAIGKYSNSKNGIVDNLKFAFYKTAKKIYKLLVDIKNALHLPFGNMVFILILGFVFILILIILFLRLKRLRNDNCVRYRKTLRVLAVVFTMAFGGMYLAIYGLNNSNSMILLLFAVMLIIAVFYNRFAFLYALIIGISSTALTIYQSYFRTSYRVNFTIIFPAVLFLILSMDQKKDSTLTQNTGIVCRAIISLIPCSLFVISCINAWTGEIAPNILTYDDSVISYVTAHNDKTYMHVSNGFALLDNGYTDYFPAVKCIDNTATYGGWQIASETFHSTLDRNGIKYLFKEMINSERYRYIIREDSGYDLVNIYEVYYNNHYAKDGNTVYLELEDEIEVTKTGWLGKIETETVGIYKVVSR